MSDEITSYTVLRKGTWTGPPDDSCTLDYQQRFLRRRVLETMGGRRFVVNLAQTTSLDDGDAFELEDGTRIGVLAAEEPLLKVAGPDLARLAWHIGNRHMPCQIESDHLRIQRDPVIRQMLDHLGATVTEIVTTFTPEGGAYGHGRTHGHAHGEHDHAH